MLIPALRPFLGNCSDFCGVNRELGALLCAGQTPSKPFPEGVAVLFFPDCPGNDTHAPSTITKHAQWVENVCPLLPELFAWLSTEDMSIQGASLELSSQIMQAGPE